MAQAWQAFPSGTPSTGINSVDRTWVDVPESIGRTDDPVAVDAGDENSAFSLLKGIAYGVTVPLGEGLGDTNDAAKVYADPLETLGDMADPPAVNAAAANSAISLMKGILVTAGLPS